MRSLHLWIWISLLGVLAAACNADTAVPTTGASEGPPVAAITMTGSSVPTHQGLDGNRFVAGEGQPPGSETLVMSDEPILWLAGYDDGLGSVVVAVDATGRVTVADAANRVASGPIALPPGMPPLVVSSLDSHVVPNLDGAAPFSVPAVYEDGTLLYVADTGDLVVVADDRSQRFAVDALPDGRIVVGASGRALVLTEPTNRYGHAVLGDEVEAAGFVVFDAGSGTVTASRTLDAPAVFEAVVPMWADVDDDDVDEIVLTVSDPDGGARIVVYEEDGSLLAEGPPIGRGFRWRHLIAVGPFGPGGETEIAVVRTPHIGGVLEMYRLQDEGLVIVDSLAGPFGSHALRSRNLDMAVAGDFDRDGQPEIVLPGADRRSVRRDPPWTRRSSEGVVHRLAGIVDVKSRRRAVSRRVGVGCRPVRWKHPAVVSLAHRPRRR